MLTDKQIRNYINEGKIRISPFEDKLIKTSSYGVRLGLTLLIPIKGQTIDLKNSDIQPEYEKHEMTDDGYLFKSGEFILGQTFEKLGTDSDILTLIDGRSTLARLGISVHQSSTVILPGQDNQIITLEMYNSGPFNVNIYPNINVGKFIFFQSSEMNEISYEKYSKYAGQSETTGARITGII